MVDLFQRMRTIGDSEALPGMVYLWLTNAASLRTAIATKGTAFYGLSVDELTTMTDIDDVYQAKATNIAKLDYAMRVKLVFEMTQSRDNVFGGMTYPLTDGEIEALLEL